MVSQSIPIRYKNYGMQHALGPAQKPFPGHNLSQKTPSWNLRASASCHYSSRLSGVSQQQESQAQFPHLAAGQPWAAHLTCLHLHFLIFKMGIK